jgi:hypothetical protein
MRQCCDILSGAQATGCITNLKGTLSFLFIAILSLVHILKIVSQCR